MGINNLYLHLKDPNERKRLLELIYSDKKNKRKEKLKEW
jgi:hypothetical protein